MEKDNNIVLNEGHIKFIGFIFLFLLLNFNKRSSKRLSLADIDETELDKKCKLLNRIKSYMNGEEQYVLHRAEVILQIIGKAKFLLEGSQLNTFEVEYNSLSLADRRKNMLLDLSKHMEEKDREMIYTAIDLDMKARTIEKKIKELQVLAKEGINIQNVEKIIEVVEPLLEGEIRDRTKEIKKITGIMKIIKAIDEKGSIDEMDLMEAVSAYIPSEQRDTLMKMMQIAKAVGSTMNKEVEKEDIIEETSNADISNADISNTMEDEMSKVLTEKAEKDLNNIIPMEQLEDI